MRKLNVRTFNSLLPDLIDLLKYKQDTFKAGCISKHFDEWVKLTNDQEILEMVSGTLIEFDTIPTQTMIAKSNVAPDKGKFVEKEISSLLQKDVIEHCSKSYDDFVSPIFLRPKNDGSHRMVLNLKSLNKYVKYHHFKMDMLKQNCYMASIDLKDAYYSVPIAQQHQKYLKFKWNKNFYKYKAFPNGLAICPRKFTKLFKPVYSWLRNQGHLSVSYIDDSYLQGSTYEECLANVIDTIKLFDKLGFVIHPTKSVLQPTQTIKFLGFTLDSLYMKVCLTTERKESIKTDCCMILEAKAPKIRDVARVIGKITASFPGVMLGPLHFRALDMNKTEALRVAKGSYNHRMHLSDDAKNDLTWWINNVESSFNVVDHGKPNVIITSDASKTGWGCTCNGNKSGGLWTSEEKAHHINYLEMKAAFFAIRSFLKDVLHSHVKILLDNTTAVACLNKMGTSHSIPCNNLTREIWHFCSEHNIWLTAAHIAGVDNIEADSESRSDKRETEWALNNEFYTNAMHRLQFQPNIDLFASRINYKVKTYAAYRPDPEATFVDAFSFPWTNYLFYAFPPFCIILKTLKKVTDDKATGVIVAPHWPTQPWWPYLSNMFIDFPIMIPRTKETLIMPADPTRVHPLHIQLQLLICHISGDHCKAEDFRRQYCKSLKTRGDQEQRNNTGRFSSDGKDTVVKGILIPFHQI